jgi:hypothetical protein
MATEGLTECPGCGRATKTVFGHCPQCGYAKNPGAAPYTESYIARGRGPNAGPFGSGLVETVGLGALPGLGIAALGLFVFDSVAVAIVGVVVVVVGSLVSIALGSGGV